MSKKPLLLLSIALFPIAASAASIHFGDYFLKGAENAPDDVYVVGQTATFAGSIAGDAAAVGRTVFYAGDISGDALFLGENVTLGGVVGDDARLFGDTITIDGTVSDDVVAVGSRIVIGKGAKIEGALYAIGGEVLLRGTVSGDAKIFASKTIVSGAVSGDLEVWKDVSFERPAAIGGDLIRHTRGASLPPVNVAITGKIIDSPSSKKSGLPLEALLGGFFSLKALMMLALGFALFFLARERSEGVLLETMSGFGRRLVRGVLIMVVMSLSMLLLFPSVIGIPLVVVLGCLLLLLVVLSWGYAGLLLGAWVEQFLFKRSPFPLTYRPVLLGTILLSIISFIPLVGPIVHGVLLLAAAGSIGTMFYRAMKQN